MPGRVLTRCCMSMGPMALGGFLAIFLTGCAMNATAAQAEKIGGYWMYIS